MTFFGIFQKRAPLTREEENELITKFQNGDKQAGDELFRANAHSIFSWCMRLTKNQNKAEDMFSFLTEHILEAFHKYDINRGNRLCTFLGTVIQRRAGRHFKSLNTEEVYCSIEDLDIIDEDQNTDERAVYDEFMRCVHEFLERMPDNAKTILKYRQDGMSHKQIASELRKDGVKISLTEVANTMNSVRDELINHLRQSGMCDRKFIGEVFSKEIPKCLFDIT